MLQRIQTVYLALALVAIILLGLFPVVRFLPENRIQSGKMGLGSMEVSAFEETLHQDYAAPESIASPQKINYHIWHYLNLAVWSASLLLILVCIFLYRNRVWQNRICWISLALILSLSVLIYLNINELKFSGLPRSLDIGAFSLSASLLLILLARKQIVKDEKLVRSVDRLR
jgi:hypothetical protein